MFLLRLQPYGTAFIGNISTKRRIYVFFFFHFSLTARFESFYILNGRRWFSSFYLYLEYSIFGTTSSSYVFLIRDRVDVLMSLRNVNMKIIIIKSEALVIGHGRTGKHTISVAIIECVGYSFYYCTCRCDKIYLYMLRLLSVNWASHTSRVNFVFFSFRHWKKCVFSSSMNFFFSIAEVTIER